MRQKFLVTDNVPHGFVEKLQGLGFEVTHIPDLYNHTLLPIIGEFDGMVISTQVRMDKTMLDAAVRMKYILRPGSGLDNVDLPYTEIKGIKVWNSPEGNREAVSEHCLALLLNLMNYIPRAWEAVKRMEWIRTPNTGAELKGKTVGIIGYGNTGTAFAQKLLGFGAQILAYDKYKEIPGEDHWVSGAEMEDLYEQADVVSLHIPLTAETKYLVNDEFISRFRKPVYLLNTARGGIVDTDAVITGLENGRLAGAGLDVLENERFDTYTDEEKTRFRRLLEAGNVVITPHIAGWTEEARKKIFFIVLDKFEQWYSANRSGKD
jgi:D-3-phosphoglycerate dehydrogenase